MSTSIGTRISSPEASTYGWFQIACHGFIPVVSPQELSLKKELMSIFDNRYASTATPPISTSSMAWLGQTLTHIPQPMQ